MANKLYKVLFICKDNAARSIMAEVLMNRLAKDRFRAFSAGINPRGEVDAMTLETLRRHRLSTEGLVSKSWQQFIGVNDQIDFVIAIRDREADEECPVLPGRRLTACWNVADPAAHQGAVAPCANVFHRAFRELENRIRIMACLRIDALERLSLAQRSSAATVPQVESPA